MQSTQQTDTQNVLEHGLSVWKYTQKIISGEWRGFKLPDWFKENWPSIINNLHSWDVIKDYNIYHDCGKPYCIEYDSEGKRHFPDHAEVSKKTFLEVFPDKNLAADLIGFDMHLHTKTLDEIVELKWDVKTAMTLLVTAFAELHSNADMFGGIDSTSFKIKYKKLDKGGKALIKQYLEFEEQHNYVYVIVRNDMPKRHSTVQGTHAAMEQVMKHCPNVHPSVIYVVVKNEQKLKKVANDLIDRGIQYSIFSEPNGPFKHQLTAICTELLCGEGRDFMQKFQLLD